MAAAGNSNAGVVARHFRCLSRNGVTQLSSSPLRRLPRPRAALRPARYTRPPSRRPRRPRHIHRRQAPDVRRSSRIHSSSHPSNRLDLDRAQRSTAPEAAPSSLRAGSTPTHTPHVVWIPECRRRQNHYRPFRLRPRLRTRTTLRKRGMMTRRTSRRALGRRHI